MFNISVAICTTNLAVTSMMLRSLFRSKNCQQREVIVVLDGCFSNAEKETLNQFNIRIIENGENKGLSYSRNVACKNAVGDFILFFDDDVIIFDEIISKYNMLINSDNVSVCGGNLLFPWHKQLPFWFPVGGLSLVGVHYNEAKIWGANFCFDRKLALKNNIFFKDSLGRKGKRLQSGDDTVFIEELMNVATGKKIFKKDFAVVHNIQEERFRISYLMRRAFWQGRSEVMRCNIKSGMKKEAKRYFRFKNFMFLPQILISIILLFSCFLGVVWEYCSNGYKKKF